MNHKIAQRSIFDEAALLYRDARPRYPEALFDKLIQITDLPKNAHLLEIGPGTGQATLSLAERGYKITAIELGPRLSAVAKQELKAYPQVKIITGSFEIVNLPVSSFDLIYSATAFHWIKPEMRFTKTHELLKPEGHLAVIHTEHISDEAGDKFFKASQPIYKKYFPDTTSADFILPHFDKLQPSPVDQKLFKPVAFEAFPLLFHYSAKGYIQLLSTYSSNLELEPKTRTRFLNELGRLIDHEFDGKVSKHFAMTLHIVKKI